MKYICKERTSVVELEEALADYIDYGMADGGHNLFSDILPRICSLELAGCAQNLKEYVRMPVSKDNTAPKNNETKHIAIGAFDTVLMVTMAFFFSLCMLQHFYPLG